jgi:hypothetical protein
MSWRLSYGRPHNAGYGIPFYEANGFLEEFSSYQSFVSSQLDGLYGAFYEFTIAANLHAAAHSDIMIDINEINANPAARAWITERLSEVGLEFNLEDCSIPVYPVRDPKEEGWMTLEEPALDALQSSAPTQRTPARSAVCDSTGLGAYWSAVLRRFPGENV